MFFQFGLDKEAEIYCTSSKIGLSSQASFVEEASTAFAKEMRDANIAHMSFDGVVNYIVEKAREACRMNGWAMTDEQGIAWFIGLFTKGYIKAVGIMAKPYETVFKVCFKKHFSEY